MSSTAARNSPTPSTFRLQIPPLLPITKSSSGASSSLNTSLSKDDNCTPPPVRNRRRKVAMHAGSTCAQTARAVPSSPASALCSPKSALSPSLQRTALGITPFSRSAMGRPPTGKSFVRARPPTGIRKARYVLHRANTQTVPGGGGMSPPAGIVGPMKVTGSALKLTPEIVWFMRQMWNERGKPATTEMEKVLAQFLLPRQALFLCIRSGLSQDLTNLMTSQDYASALESLARQSKAQQLNLGEQLCEGVCRFALRGEDALYFFSSLARRHPKNPVVLYNLAICQVLSKAIIDSVKTLNQTVGILIKKNDTVTLPHAVRLRAVANFEAQAFEYAFQDLSFYSTVYTHILQPDDSLLYCQFDFRMPEHVEGGGDSPLGADNFTEASLGSSTTLSVMRKRGSEAPVRVLFRNTGAVPSVTKRKIKHLSRKNSAVMPKELKIKTLGRTQVKLAMDTTARPRPPTSKPANKVCRSANMSPEHSTLLQSRSQVEDEPKLRFVDRKDQPKVFHERLEQRVGKLREEFEHTFFTEEFAKLQKKVFDPVKHVTKEVLLKELEERKPGAPPSTLSLVHIGFIKSEICKEPKDRDYDFLDKVLSSLAFLSKLKPEERTSILQSCAFEEVAGSGTLYSEGTEGISTCKTYVWVAKDMYIIIRGSVGHRVKKLVLGDQEVCTSSAFDGECVGWTRDEQKIRTTTCVVSTRTLNRTCVDVRGHVLPEGSARGDGGDSPETVRGRRRGLFVADMLT